MGYWQRCKPLLIICTIWSIAKGLGLIHRLHSSVYFACLALFREYNKLKDVLFPALIIFSYK